MIAIAKGLAIARANWKPFVAGAVLISLVVALLLARSSAAHWQTVADQRAYALTEEQIAHDVTRGSVETLKRSIARQNEDVAARAAALDLAKAQAAGDVAAADARWKATADQVATLKAIAVRPASNCPAPADLIKALEGL